ncbi:MAG TPA: dihydrodipicolinate synthase family protein [Ginsengibacter sp.]|nr:dihydrodipicolinate synthase family protein [Ginsengibacter sp.]HRP18000.1 dihydrodipicolinate synthase family protein [Ginsengibacter sp.]HRP45104.1 dihydrodipicolinate synthase family protein [Ginsengibacter sp.]
MKSKHLKGLIAAPFTPMHADGSLNLSLIPEYYRFLKSNKVTGGFICGSTGEGVSLTLQEKKDTARAWADCTNDDPDFDVMLLLGGTCIADCIELAKYAQEIGLFAVSFTAPFYFKPADAKMLASCCREIADAVPAMPFYYYHIPVLNGCHIPMINLLQEVDGTIPNFAGVKYTHEDFMDFLSCLRFQNGKYDMLWGRDENMLAALSLGSKGAVGSTYNYAAPLYNEMTEAFERNDLGKAQALQQTSIDMISLLGKYGGIATGKAYMKLVGIDCGKFRLPVKNMSDKDFDRFRTDTEILEFKNFCSKK